MSRLARMIAVAVQKYGVVVRDQTSGVNAFIAEEPAPGTANPVGALLDGRSTMEAMESFPWGRLQVLDAPVCTGYATACAVDDTAVLDVDRDRRDATMRYLDTANSSLNFPRDSVRWDLDGDGAYETSGGRQVRRRVDPSDLGRRVGVQITTRSGAVVSTSAAVPRTGAPRGSRASSRRP